MFVRRVLALTLVTFAGCSKKDAPPPAPTEAKAAPSKPIDAGAVDAAVDAAAAATDGPRAFVIDDGKLVEVTATGGRAVVVPSASEWCRVDMRANVVWLYGADGLAAYDLVDRKLHPIAKLDPDFTAGAEIIIDWGTEQLGGESAVHYDIALALHLTKPIRASSKVGCDGDQAVYCFTDDNKLKPALVAKAAALDKTKLLDAAYVTTLAARGAKGSLRLPLPKPGAKPTGPTIKPESCTAMPEECGKLKAVPGSALWIVTTSNSRGDFYHESRQLWDPATHEYLALKDGTLARSKLPEADSGDLAGLLISSTGLFSADGLVFDSHAVLFKPDSSSAVSCGFTGGSWRIPGATEPSSAL